MGVKAPNKQLALDTNLLFDLAADKDFAHTFREVFQERGYELKVPPTVIQELAFQAHQKDCTETSLALKALRNMRKWELIPFELMPVGNGITELFSNKLMENRLLPEGEFNDGLILAEAALASIPVLVTSDSDLLDIDEPSLILLLKEADLPLVKISHPKNLMRAMVRLKRHIRS
jgi:predicted nucleic acid-binding protein